MKSISNRDFFALLELNPPKPTHKSITQNVIDWFEECKKSGLLKPDERIVDMILWPSTIRRKFELT